MSYRDQGKFNEAEKLEIQVLDMREKLLGKSHPDTLLTMGNLASTYRHQRKLNKAKQLVILVYQIEKQAQATLSSGHPQHVF